jgi:hypothetical protein
MKTFAVSALLVLSGCATAPSDSNPPMRAGGPNWEEVDKSVQRIKERENQKGRLVETERKVEQGFLPMSDVDYSAALASARDEVRKANPKMSEGEVEAEAITRADQAKWRYEHSPSTRASSTYEWKTP